MYNEKFYTQLIKSVFLLAGEILLKEDDINVIFYDARSDLEPGTLTYDGLKKLFSDSLTVKYNLPRSPEG